MSRRYWLYLLGAIGLIVLLWLVLGGGDRKLRVIQPAEGLPPGTRFLQVRWKEPLEDIPEGGARIFRVEPEVPVLSVFWASPTEAVIELGEGLEAGTTYTLVGEAEPLRGKARFFTQPIAVVQAEGGYVWGEQEGAYRQAIYLRTNTPLSETQLAGKWGEASIVRFVSLGQSEFLAVSDRPAQKPFSGELVVNHGGERIYEAEVKGGAFDRYELRQTEVDFEGGRYFIRLRGNRPILAEAARVASYIHVGSKVELGELEVRGIEARLYLGQLPGTPFEVYLKPGFPDGQQGLFQAETLQLAPPPTATLAWAQSNIHYVAQGQGLHFVVGPSVQTLRLKLWRIHPENERLFYQMMTSYYYDGSDRMRYYGSPVIEGSFPVGVFPKVRSQNGLITRTLGKELEPGTYYVEMASENAPWQSISTWFVVSDWYLLAREWDKEVWVAALEKKSGRPLSGVRVLVVNPNGTVLSEGTTGREGVVIMERPPLAATHAVIAERGKQSLFLPLRRFRPTEWPYPTDGFDPRTKPYHLYLTGARTLYRPGDTLSIHGYLRTHDWKYPEKAPPLKATLQDPRFQTILSLDLSLDENGHFHLTYPLPRDAITGTYQLQILTSADAEEKRIRRIWEEEEENFQIKKTPEWSYPIQVEFFRADRMVIEARLLSIESRLSLSITGSYLYGAVASFQRGEVSAELRSAIPETPLARGYTWEVRLPDDLKRDFLKPTEFQTDARGQATIPLPSLTGLGLVEVNATIMLYDEENRPNYLKRTFPYATQPVLVGIRQDMRWVSAGDPVTLTLRALSGPNYSELARGSHTIDAEVWELTYEYNLFQSYYDQYRSDYQVRRRRIMRTKVEVRDGAGELTFTPHTGGTYEVLLRAPGQQAPTIYQLEAWGWGSTALKGPTEGQILIQPQDSAPRAGTKVALLLKAPLPGKALLTVEREKVWYHEWVDLSSGTATLTLKLPEAWAPGVYIHVVAFHAIGDKAVPFASSRGLIYLPLSRPEGVATLTLKAPERVKPGTPITLSLEAPGHPRARILLTGLDEGVWVKQMYKPRRPEEVFYQKWAHTLNVSEHLPFVASWGREVIGGGDFMGYDEAGNASLLTAEAYEHTIAYEQVLQLDEKGRAEVRLTVPAFSGKIRWRAYLVGENVYGSAEAFSLVAAPVVGRMGVPFYIAGGEEIETQLTLRNTTDQPQSGTWRIAVPANGMEVTPATGSFSLSPGSAQTVKLRYRATRPWGLAKVALYVNEELAQEREIRIRPAAAPRLVSESITLAPGMDTTITIPPDFFQNPEGAAHLVVSTAPVHELGPAILQLLRFPHGCAEQITSQAFVSLKLGDLAAAFHAARADTVRKHVQYVLGRLPLYRAGSGFSFWPGGSQDTWLTLHICHFLIEASEAGYEEARTFLNSLIEFLEYTLKSESPSSYFAAYSAFLLARQKGSKVASLLPSVKRVEEGRDPVVRAFWRAAFKLAKVPTLPPQLPVRVREEDFLYYYYYAIPEVRYWYAESFVNPAAVPVSFREQLRRELADPYLSTHHALWLLLTYQRMYAFQKTLSGQIAIGGRALPLSGMVGHFRPGAKEAQAIRLKAERETLYVFLWAESYPVTAPSAVSRGLVVTEEIIPKGGRQYVWRIRLSYTGSDPLENVALTVPYPSGFMLDRSSLSEESRYPPAQGLSWDYTDPREDRFLGYFKMIQKEAQIELPIRLIYAGRYQVPSISAMVMYVPTIHGSTAARSWETGPF